MKKITATTPGIRFKRFTDSWEQRKLGELYQKNTEKNDDLIGYNKTISIATMTYKNEGNGASDASLAGYKVIRVGDLAFEGHTNKQFHYGRFVVNDIGTGIMSPRFTTLRPKNTLPVAFWKYYIHYEPIMGRVLVNATKAGRMMNELVVPEFLEQTINVPSTEEQKCLGTYFADFDKLIILYQRKLEQQKKLKKYFLQNMFPAKGEKVPKIRLKGFSGDWQQYKIGDITNVLSASRVHKEEWASCGVPFFRSSDVVAAFKGTKNNKAYISFDLYNQLVKSSGKLEKNDILITGGGSIGTPYIVPDNQPLYSKDADLIWIKHSSNFDSRYLYTYFTTDIFKGYLHSISHTGTIAHYTIEQVKDTPVTLPMIDEQRQIGNYISRLNNDIMLYQRKIEVIQSLKKYMLQNMFI